MTITSYLTTLTNLPKKARLVMKILRERRKGTRDYILSAASFLLRRQRAWGKPVLVTVEPTNRCNLDCPVCETGAGVLDRAPGHITPERFQSLLDGGVGEANTLFFYFMGEPFMNRSVYDMLARAKGRSLYIISCTNGELVDPEKVVESGMDEIRFQIGGTTQETHEIYRVRGNLAKALDRCRETVRARNSRHRTTPKVRLGLIVMKHNEHQLDDFQRLARETGADDAILLRPHVRDLDQGEHFLTQDDRYWIYDREMFSQGILEAKGGISNACPWIYFTTTILWNGDVVPCCGDPKGRFILGNVHREPLDKVWNGDRYRAFRNRVLTDQASIEMCRICPKYGPPALMADSPRP